MKTLPDNSVLTNAIHYHTKNGGEIKVYSNYRMTTLIYRLLNKEDYIQLWRSLFFTPLGYLIRELNLCRTCIVYILF